MGTAMNDETSTASLAPPSRWSPTSTIGVAVVSFLVFVVVQLTAVGIVIAKTHPEYFQTLGEAVRGQVTQATAAAVALKVTDEVSTAPYLLLYAVVGDGGMILGAIALSRRWLGATPRDLGFTRFEAKYLGIGIAAGIGLTIVSDVCASIQAKFFGPHTENVLQLMMTHKGLLNFCLDLLSVAIIAPLAEEYLFRGVLFNGLAQWMPAAWAAIVSGVLFACAHFDRWSIFPLAAIGVGLALLYRRYGSLWPNIVAHATINTLALIAVYYVPRLAT
jgi:uncharacterized protein